MPISGSSAARSIRVAQGDTYGSGWWVVWGLVCVFDMVVKSFRFCEVLICECERKLGVLCIGLFICVRIMWSFDLRVKGSLCFVCGEVGLFVCCGLCGVLIWEWKWVCCVWLSGFVCVVDYVRFWSESERKWVFLCGEVGLFVCLGLIEVFLFERGKESALWTAKYVCLCVVCWMTHSTCYAIS